MFFFFVLYACAPASRTLRRISLNGWLLRAEFFLNKNYGMPLVFVVRMSFEKAFIVARTNYLSLNLLFGLKDFPSQNDARKVLCRHSIQPSRIIYMLFMYEHGIIFSYLDADHRTFDIGKSNIKNYKISFPHSFYLFIQMFGSVWSAYSKCSV